METNTKDRIRQAVSEYKKLFPDEYQAVVDHIKNERRSQATDWATLEGNHAIERKLGEVPETLFSMITQMLTVNELNQFRATGDAGKKAQRWFFNAFPEFRVTKEA